MLDQRGSRRQSCAHAALAGVAPAVGRNPACRRAQPPSSRHHSAGVLPGGWRVRSRGSCALSGFCSRPNRVGSTLIPASSSAAVCQLHCSQLMPTAQACKKQAGCNGWTFCWRLDGCGSGCTVSCEPYPWAGQAAHSTCCGGAACGQHLLLPPRLVVNLFECRALLDWRSSNSQLCFDLFPAAAGKPPSEIDPTKELGQFGRQACPFTSPAPAQQPLLVGWQARMRPCPCSAASCQLVAPFPSQTAPTALPPCSSCAPGERFPFRTCTLKRLSDTANPPVWDDSTDWTSGAVVA